MSDRDVSYVCMRPSHHRDRTLRPWFEIHLGRTAYCPASAADGHMWVDVPDLPLDTLTGFGRILIDGGGASPATDSAAELVTAGSAGHRR